MLLKLTNRTHPATDLGFLLAKHPDRFQTFGLPLGKVHAFYPEATESSCTFALLLDLDPVGLVRGRRSEPNAFQYVNDRPYVASSFLCTALSKVLGSALNGTCTARPGLAEAVLELEAELPAVPCRGGGELLLRLFEPLGYELEATPHVLDEKFPEWGDSPYFTVRLSRATTVREFLTHLYVLLPVLDNEKHYWVGEAELEKLLARGKGWLGEHPERELITRRYLKHQGYLTREVLARLSDENEPDPEAQAERSAAGEAQLEAPMSLNRQRYQAVADALIEAGARAVVDLGCGEGRLLRELFRMRVEGRRAFESLVGVDVSFKALERAAGRLGLDRLSDSDRKRIRVFQGALTYRDKRLEGFDAACLVEVIEHLDATRLEALERVVFEFARPKAVVLSTPNVEYNVLFESLESGAFRHRDHRFEWTRSEFEAWCTAVGARYGYSYALHGIGEPDPVLGSPTQMAVFKR